MLINNLPLLSPFFYVCNFLIIVDAVSSWGGGHGRDSHTEWQVTTNHSQPMPEKSQAQTGNGWGSETDNHIKVALVGAPGVGKTSLVQVM